MSKKPISTETRTAIVALRPRGMTPDAAARLLGVPVSTVTTVWDEVRAAEKKRADSKEREARKREKDAAAEAARKRDLEAWGEGCEW